jgi:hypothetical protein
MFLEMHKKHQFFLIVIFFAFFQIEVGFSQIYYLDQTEISTKEFLKDNELFVFEDTSASLSFATISEASFQYNFSPVKKDNDYSNKSFIWLKFTIKNNSTQ